ncbi:nicotinate mononucleotide-dependent phosphoribosyltransferase CobT [Picosynechococcus sp. PCC 8807]|uniref:nicotinate mononucleotide-dependent phosphoribosyltransferase CobT n=1 Tax=Picosynechococcus sp. PCC 8807 TaxID=195248 RepID=UPI000810A7EB|nr:TIGR00303 family protein [Picosynechococcus sp. PCC 8807]ANV90743.1 TIGR00303 family protein [Picosynechococcus sp. PCC 8807]
MIRIYTQQTQGQAWLSNHQQKSVVFACGLGFTDTALIPNISAAGATPEARKYTAIADAECVCHGFRKKAIYPLPPLIVGASPAILSRAILQYYQIPAYLFDTGLWLKPDENAVHCIDVGGQKARCVSTGKALEFSTVNKLFEQGLTWGETLATQYPNHLFMLGECVVAGTTTALGVLTGLGYDANQKVNSSYIECNHDLKWQIVQTGLKKANLNPNPDPFAVVAAVGDPMQIFVAGMAIALSRTQGVLLAGGTQMLAVYALIQRICEYHSLDFDPKNIAVGTTRWVAEDPTGDTVGLAELIGEVPLLATQLSFQTSQYSQLQSYEQGYVKEGVGAGGLAIAAHLAYGATQAELLAMIERTIAPYLAAD